jgi:hypothetical protein
MLISHLLNDSEALRHHPFLHHGSASMDLSIVLMKIQFSSRHNQTLLLENSQESVQGFHNVVGIPLLAGRDVVCVD